jgi:DNA-binding NarL/FixJ family response regulator
MKKDKITLLVADDSLIILKGLKALLNAEGYYNAEFVNSGIEVINKLKTKTYSILLMDINMDEMNGIEVLKEMQAFKINQKTIIFSSYTQVDFILNVFKYDALGYVSKTFLAEKLTEAIEQALTGSVYLSDDVKEIMEFHNLKLIDKKVQPYNLSEQQLEIIKMFVNGYNSNEIALEKELSPSSIRNQFMRIREKFNIKTNIGIAIKYIYLIKN